MAIRCTRSALVSLALLALAPSGCRRDQHSVIDPPAPVSAPGPFRVTALELGSAIDSDKRVVSLGASFAPNGTIYASVLSEGAAPEVTIGTRWTFEDGQVVSESTRVVMPSGPAATEFHVARPNGWPSGRYTVEVTADGVSAASRDFEVK